MYDAVQVWKLSGKPVTNVPGEKSGIEQVIKEKDGMDQIGRLVFTHVQTEQILSFARYGLDVLDRELGSLFELVEIQVQLEKLCGVSLLYDKNTRERWTNGRKIRNILLFATVAELYLTALQTKASEQWEMKFQLLASLQLCRKSARLQTEFSGHIWRLLIAWSLFGVL